MIYVSLVISRLRLALNYIIYVGVCEYDKVTEFLNVQFTKVLSINTSPVVVRSQIRPGEK